MSNFTLFSQIRDHNREEAKKTLLAKHPSLEQLFKQMDVYMGQLVLFLNDKPTYDDKDKYHLPLAVTFIRLHYSIIDFLLSCDIIEASVLLRKQVEILARYHEVEQGIKPRGKGSANVHLISDKNIQKRIYGNLCDIAHYTKDESYYYLGYDNIDEDPNAPTVISTLAEYGEKVMNTISDFCEVFDYFCMLMQQYQKHLDANFSADSENAWHKYEFEPTGKKLGLKYFVDTF